MLKIPRSFLEYVKLSSLANMMSKVNITDLLVNATLRVFL